MDNKKTIQIPSGAAEILRVLETGGYEAFVVGGCVRDSLLGRNPNDWDITTSARPEEVKALFRRTIDTGLKHGTVTILRHGEAYEVTTYRIDGEYLDGRHPSDVTFTASLEEDLKRRDFTINAMAYSESAGLKDFLLDYDVDPETVRAMKELAPTLSRISAERIAAELEKTILSPHPEKLRMARECGITAVILPEFDRCMDTPQNNPHHLYNVGEHTIRSMMNVRPDKVLRLTMLMHDFGKPACRTTDEKGIDHFYGHPAVSADMADNILRRLKYDNDTRKSVVKLTREHDRCVRLTEPGIRKAVIEIGEDLFPLWLEVKEADTLAQSLYRRQEKMDYLEKIRTVYGRILERGDCISLKDLAVTGNDLIAAGVPKGKEIGGLLRKMFQDVVDVPSHNDRDYLLKKYLPPVQAGDD